MYLFRLVLLVVSVSFPVVSQSQDNTSSPHPGPGWKVVATTDKEVFFVHMPSIRRHGNIVDVWELSDFPNTKAPSKSTKFLYRYDCKNRSYYARQSTHYSEYGGRGDIMSSSIEEEPVTKVIAGTVGETLLELVCKK
jgi:hypothetical protein